MQDFIKTNDIYLLENEINNLENKLADKKSILNKMIKSEFEKQFNLKEGKTILKYRENEYVYAEIYEINFLWIKGFTFNKNGKVSLRTKNLYTDWEHTGKDIIMPRGKVKSRYNFETNNCEYEKETWCELPKLKRCEYCIRCKDGSKVCGVIAF